MVHFLENSERIDIFMKMNKLTHFGYTVSMELDRNGYSIKDLAIKLRCTERTIRRHMTGKRRPSYMDCMAYAVALGCNADFLWTAVEDTISDDVYESDGYYDDEGWSDYSRNGQWL